MSFFDDDIVKEFKKSVRSDFKKREEERKILKDPQLKEQIKKEAKKHYKKQLKKPLKVRWHYTDEFGYDITAVKTHPKPLENSDGKVWNLPEKIDDDRGEYKFPTDYPLLSTTCNVKMKAKDILTKEGKIKNIFNYGLLLRGEMYVMYKDLQGDDDIHFRKEFLKMHKVNSIKDIDFATYSRYFTFRAHQILEAKKLGGE